jgi:hypothetical protein
MNPFVSDYKTRLHAWKQLRIAIAQTPDAAQAIDVCLAFWRQAPLQNHVMNCDDETTWPTAWEMIKQNDYCTHMHSLGIAETLRLSDERWQHIHLCYLRDREAQVEKMVCVTEHWVLNHGHVDRCARHQLKHVNKLTTWAYQGKSWCRI